jgi:hypothetical protein
MFVLQAGSDRKALAVAELDLFQGEKVGELKNNAIASHRSKGIDITRQRLIDFNEDGLVTPIEFFDLYDDERNPSGTQVTCAHKRKFNPSSI